MLAARAAIAVIALALIGVVVPQAPASAVAVDFGAEDVPRSVTVHATCAKVGAALVRTTSSDPYARSRAFTSVNHPVTLARNVVTSNDIIGGLSFTTRDVVRCSATATRRRAQGRFTVYYTLTYAPDLTDLLVALDSGSRVISLPPSRPSVTYQTGVRPSWAGLG